MNSSLFIGEDHESYTNNSFNEGGDIDEIDKLFIKRKIFKNTPKKNKK
jgi:hypothetical protein